MYEVVVLAERELADVDARVLADLYRETPEPTHLHVLLPVEEAEGRVEALLSVLSSGRSQHEAAPPVRPETVTADESGQRDVLAQDVRSELHRSLDRLRSHGLDADGETVPHEPIDALEAVVAARGSNEVVIMTRTHIVTETLHRDWTSAARRTLGVPVLHLLEQAES